MTEPTCSSCKYFYQHYCVFEGKFHRIHCGHCVQEKAKSKRPDKKACEHYMPGSEPTEIFATEEYLTKALLDYALSLELLPEIPQASD